MKQNNSRGRPMKSDKVKIKAVPQSEIDIKKMAQALISIAKDIEKKKTALSQPEYE